MGDNMKQYLQTLAEELNDTTEEKHTIKVGRYKGQHYLGDEKFKQIEGDLFIRTNFDTLFRVISDDGIIDDFDILVYDSIYIPSKESD